MYSNSMQQVSPLQVKTVDPRTECGKTHSSTGHSRNCFYKRKHVNYNFTQKDCNTKCKSCLRTTSNMVMSHKPFSLQGLYNLHTGHAPSPSSSGFRRLSPPGQPWRSSNTSNSTRVEQSVIAAKVSHPKHV